MARAELAPFPSPDGRGHERLMAYHISEVSARSHAIWLDRYSTDIVRLGNFDFAAECLGERADTLVKRKMI